MSGVLLVERSYPAQGSHLCGMTWDGHHLWYADAGTEKILAMSSAEGGQGEDLIPGKYIRQTK
jgi:hypothetical protein